MQYRDFGQTGWKVSTVGFGAWEIGAEWGPMNDDESMAAMHKAVDLGVNFFDTSDVYGAGGNGHSEKLLGRLRQERSEPIYIATKVGRKLNPHVAAGYTLQNLSGFVEQSLKNLGVERIDLLQLHCPPYETYYTPETFAALDELVRQGKVQFYGVSVQKTEEALKAIEYPNLQSVQIVFNVFRQRPAELFFQEAARRHKAVIARVPLASGMLTGKMRPDTHFDPDDHRVFNRKGEIFDRGETFSGVDYATGLRAVEELRPLVPPGVSLAQFALRWILMFDAVSCTIPGAKRPAQVVDNAGAADLPALSPEGMAEVKAIYDRSIRPLVQHYW
ncbi:MAG TPA: aldo/keto reductase [Anaerolineaceae bacterium]|jgi:aryl-alcohol dehydrogenase-like predicted oxidoreductase